jgi:hypothetical protein
MVEGGAMRKLWVGLGFAAGYVLGARAGRERYEQLKRQATQLAEKPQVKEMTQRVTSTTGTKVQETLRQNPRLQKVRDFTTSAGGRRQGDTAAETAETPFTPGSTTPPADPLASEAERLTDPMR